MSRRLNFANLEKALNNLKTEYDRRFDDLPVNEFGETDADALLSLNRWAALTKADIYDIFSEYVKKL